MKETIKTITCPASELCSQHDQPLCLLVEPHSKPPSHFWNTTHLNVLCYLHVTDVENKNPFCRPISETQHTWMYCTIYSHRCREQEPNLPSHFWNTTHLNVLCYLLSQMQRTRTQFSWFFQNCRGRPASHPSLSRSECHCCWWLLYSTMYISHTWAMVCKLQMWGCVFLCQCA